MFSPLPWFGPRGGGAWGWAPLTWEAGVISFLCVIAILAAFARYGHSRRSWTITGASLGVLLLACVVTGTSPG